MPCARALLAARGEGSPAPPQTKLQQSSARGLPTTTMLSWAPNQPRADAALRLLPQQGLAPPHRARCVPGPCSTHHQCHISLQLPVALGVPAAQSRAVSDAQQPELQGQHVHRLGGQGQAGGVGCRGFPPCGARPALCHQHSWAGGLSGGCRELLRACGGVLGSAGATGHSVGTEGQC